MALPLYLAMTAWEFDTDPLPALPAYMACHFSLYGRGIQDLPQSLPEGCLLILDDRIPAWRQDPKQVAEELHSAVAEHGCSGLLLDFQRPGDQLIRDIIRNITDTLPCPVAVTEAYAEDAGCAVLVGSPLPNQPLSSKTARWNGRELWLEAAPETIRYTVTREESKGEYICQEEGNYPHRDLRLCCRYRIELKPDMAVFTIQRSREDLQKLMEQAEKLGFTRAVGLYQQLRSMVTPDNG